VDLTLYSLRVATAGVLILSVAAGLAWAGPLAGDADGDGVVDLDDFVILKQNFGTPAGATWSQGDFNGDGNVDLDDFVILKQNFGLAAGVYYLDPAAGLDANPGTAAAPWQTWPHAQSVLDAGNTLYCTGTLGRVDMTAADPAGTAAEPISYRRWPGKSMPRITSLVFDGTVKDAYLVFDAFTLDPGYVTTAGLTENNAVNLDGASHLTFDNCYFEGPKLLGATGDFAPYGILESTYPPTLTAGNPGNASYITITNCSFSYSSVSIRMVEHPSYPTKLVRYWRVEGNDFEADNMMRNQYTYRSAFYWPGTASGAWPADHSFVPVTQDTTGASAIFYRMGSGRMYVLADDRDHLPARNNTYIWRLDSDPANVQFTPSSNGDSTHGDCIAVQGATRNLVIERNWMEVAPGSGQALKLDYVSGQPENITVENNLMFCRTEAPTYLVLIQGGSNSVFGNNVVYPGPDAPLARGVRFLQKSGGEWTNLQFYNNIISGAIVSSGVATSDYNCWMSTPPAAFNEGPHGMVVSGLSGVGIVDETNLDFHLLPTSVARDAGDPAQAPGVSPAHPEGVDLDGLGRDATPDIGPFEYRD